MKKVLHLSHTDIRSDSRILKEMAATAKTGVRLRGVGVAVSRDQGESVSAFASCFDIVSVRLWCRRLTKMPRWLRQGLTPIELFFRTLMVVLSFRPDVIHCHDTSALPVGILAKIVVSSKVVYDAHELESDRIGLSQFQKKITLVFERMVWGYVDVLIVVSPSIAKWYERSLGIKTPKSYSTRLS